MESWLERGRTGALGRSRSFADRDVLFERGDRATRAFVLAQGAVEIVQRSEAGLSVVVKILVGPTFFGVTEVLSGELHYLESVRALGGAEVYALDAGAFLAQLRSSASAAIECLTDMAIAFSVAARFESSRLFQAEALLANLMLAYGDVVGRPVEEGLLLSVKRTQADFAEAIGAVERSVNRILADFQERSLVDKRRGHYLLLDVPGLRRLAGDLSGSLVHRYTRGS